MIPRAILLIEILNTKGVFHDDYIYDDRNCVARTL